MNKLRNTSPRFLGFLCSLCFVLMLLSAFVISSSARLFAQDNSGSAKPNPTPPKTVGPPPPLIKRDDEIIKIDTQLVNMSVQVIDRDNRPIANLRESDFLIFEDGIAQEISFFSQAEVPTNYTLVIDNSGSLRFQLEKVIEASKIIINTNRPDDETSIIRFVSSSNISLEQDFTSNKIDLIEALDNLYTEGGPTAIIDAVYLAADQVNEYERIRNDTKRRALILVSDGEDRDSVYDEKQLFDLLRETNVQIYTIGFIEDLDKDGNFIRKSPQHKAKNFLTRLATETGGKVYFPGALGELPGIAKDIASELRTQYSIGYQPSNDRKDGTKRNIKVRMTDAPGKQIRIPRYKAVRTAEKAADEKPNPIGN